jgi:D-alanyl-D-alanine dipeptidase
MHNLRILLVSFFIIPGLFQTIPAQQSNQNPYRIQVLSDVTRYKSLIQSDPSAALIDLQKFIPGISLDIRYAGTNNFTKKVVYNSARAFLRLPAARRMVAFQFQGLYEV